MNRASAVSLVTEEQRSHDSALTRRWVVILANLEGKPVHEIGLRRLLRSRQQSVVTLLWSFTFSLSLTLTGKQLAQRLDAKSQLAEEQGVAASSSNRNLFKYYITFHFNQGVTMFMSL